jgi:hypothetical protein
VDPMSLVMDDADPVGSFVGMAMWGATPVAPGGRYVHRQFLSGVG